MIPHPQHSIDMGLKKKFPESSFNVQRYIYKINKNLAVVGTICANINYPFTNKSNH